MINKKIAFPKEIQCNGFILKAAINVLDAKSLSQLVKNNQSEFKYIQFTASLITKPKAQKAIQSMAEKWDKGEHFCYFIFDLQGTLLGYAGLKIRTNGHVAEVNYYLGKHATGKGMR